MNVSGERIKPIKHLCSVFLTYFCLNHLGSGEEFKKETESGPQKDCNGKNESKTFSNNLIEDMTIYNQIGESSNMSTALFCSKIISYSL